VSTKYKECNVISATEFIIILLTKDYAVAQLVEALRYSLKDAIATPDGVIEIFH
jgi:hypothetical protein